MKYKSLLTHLSFAPMVLLCVMTSAADAQPACRTITNPSPGSVCYTEWQFSSRQRGEGGTRTHEQLIERVAPNYVIVDTEVIIQESNGITSRPSPNIVSSSGNASIVEETSRSIRELTEVKNSLQAKAEGCVPPVCGKIQNQLDVVNQKISEYSERKRVAIEAGGNEKILFKWTTKVECSTFGICGPGAWMNGVIRVFQRYLGNPSSIKQETLSLADSSLSINSSVTKGNALVNAGGKCLDVHVPDMRNNGGRVQVWDCNGAPQQQWSLRGNTLVNVGGKCLDVHAPDMRNNGGRVQVWDCNGAPQQQWRF